MINLSSSTPPAPTGARLVTWQEDTSGNVSAYTSLSPTKTTVAPVSGVVSIDASLGNSFWITVNAAITSTAVSNPTNGQEITVVWAQDSTGHTVVLPTNFLMGTLTVTTTANKHTTAKLTYNSADGNWYIIGQNNL